MEIWDIYDGSRRKTGRTAVRGERLGEGEFHLVVHVWIVNGKGEYLITKRSPNKPFPGMWECTGGSALAGEDSLGAALRETKEETGITLNARTILRTYGFSVPNSTCATWFCRKAKRATL